MTLTDQSWTVTVPGSVLDTGIALGLLSFGDTAAGNVQASVFASNTLEGVKTSAPIAIGVGPIADGGGGKAADVSTTFSVADMTWTSVGGPVAMTMHAATVNVTIGPLEVGFSCEPDSSDPVVETQVLGSTGERPAGRPDPTSGGGTDTPTVLGVTVTQATTDSLPVTGIEVLPPLLLALGLLDLGYLIVSAAAPARRRLSAG